MIEQKITDFVSTYQKLHHTETHWRSPVIGVADALDPLYRELKEKICPGHALPSEIVPGARSVIVFFIPFSIFQVRKVRGNGTMHVLKPISLSVISAMSCTGP